MGKPLGLAYRSVAGDQISGIDSLVAIGFLRPRDHQVPNL